MKSFNLFKLVVWLFKSIANHAIFLYKWSRLHLRKLTSHITTKVNGPHKNDDEYYRVNDDDDDDYEEDEYDTTCSSSSGDEDQETCRQRKTNKKDTGDRNSEEKQSEDKMSKAVIGRRLRMKKELVLDLDETLVHSTTEWAVSYHFTVTVKLPCGVLSGESDVLRTSERSSGEQGAASDDMYPAVFYVTKRPYLDVFLKKVSKWYNLSIFTSSLRVYAEPVINEIDTRHLIKRRFYRDVNYIIILLRYYFIIFNSHVLILETELYKKT